MVLQTDKKELENHDFLNTAFLVILNSKVEYQNEIKEINSFNIYNENKMKEFESNPDGTKYPMVVFTFYDDEKIADIKLTNNMDNYNAQTIIEIIGAVVPKLTRNRAEDISNGIEINTKKDNKKRIIVESISPREIPDFKGSRFVKSIEREIENDKLTKIKTNANLNLETKLEEGERSFGLQDFKYDSKSEITLTGFTQEKTDADLVNKLISKYTLIKSEDLLESLAKKESETVIDKWEITEEEIKQDSILRNLLAFSDFNFENTYLINQFSALGTTIKIQVRIGVKSGKGFGKIIFTANQGKISFGSNGVTASASKEWKGEVTVFTFKFPPMPAIGLGLRAGGSVKISGSINSSHQLKNLLYL